MAQNRRALLCIRLRHIHYVINGIIRFKNDACVSDSSVTRGKGAAAPGATFKGTKLTSPRKKKISDDRPTNHFLYHAESIGSVVSIHTLLVYIYSNFNYWRCSSSCIFYYIIKKWRPRQLYVFVKSNLKNGFLEL